MPEERKNYVKEIIVGLFVTIVGGILVVHYQENLHKKNKEQNHTELESPMLKIERENEKLNRLVVENDTANSTISQTISPIDNTSPKIDKIAEKIKRVEANSFSEDDGISITIIDAITKNPVEGVSVSFSGFPNTLISNHSGIFIIPKSIITKRGEYNSVRAYFTRNGFEPVDYEIGLSEPQTFKINKSQ